MKTATPLSSLDTPHQTPSVSPCFHCGLPLVPGKTHVAILNGTERSFCCAGCFAVSTLIHEGGLDRYYSYREAIPASNSMSSTSIEEWRIYDDPTVQASFVKDCSAYEKEAVLFIEGIRCAACIWLNERHLLQQSGILSVHINHMNHRARIRWNTQKVGLSDILAAITAIGYNAWPFDAQHSEKITLQEQRHALFRLGVALLGMMQVMMYAWPTYFTVDGITSDHQRLLNWVSLILTLPVILYSAAPMYRSALRSLLNHQIGMDVPVVLGISTAFTASCMATLKNNGAVYFDSITMFIGLLLAARYLELRLRQRVCLSAEHISRPIPISSLRWTNYPKGQPETIASVHLKAGDVILVKAGEIFPGDGEVIEGESEADETLLTGESHPVPKRPGHTILAGSHNFSSPLVIRLHKIGEETQLAEITRLLDRALTQKPPMAQLADQVAHWFILALLLIALLTLLVWLHLDSSKALVASISVLIVSCPCALSLATPAALAAAIGSLARCSILIIGGHAIETLGHVTDVVIDKTGTLTTGQFELIETQLLGHSSQETCLKVASTLERTSEHPLARKLVEASPTMLTVHHLKNTPGMGIEGHIDGQTWRIGRYEFVSVLCTSVPQQPLMEIAPNLNTVWLGNQNGIQALFLFSDTLREGAICCINTMKKRGKRVHLLSGDRRNTVYFWAQKLGIDHIHAEATPSEKQAYVQTLQDQGKVVMMMGDGINDAPVLATAHVSVTLASGAPLAQAGADIVLMKPSLLPLINIFDTAQRTRQIIIQNLIWAFIYNIAAIPLAATGNLTPLEAGIGMSLSSLVVVANALRLTMATTQPEV